MKREMSPGMLAVMLISLGILAGVIAGVTASRQNSYSPVRAEITRIDSEYVFSDNRYDYTVYVRYNVDGQEYDEVLGYYDDSLSEGKVIDILYNPENPAQIVEASKTFNTVLLILAPVLVAAGIVIFIKKR